jgi:hypothetical protein
MTAHEDVRVAPHTLELRWPIAIVLGMALAGYAYYAGVEISKFRAELCVLKESVSTMDKKCAELTSLELRTNIDYIRRDLTEIKEQLKMVESRLVARESVAKRP